MHTMYNKKKKKTKEEKKKNKKREREKKKEKKNPFALIGIGLHSWSPASQRE